MFPRLQPGRRRKEPVPLIPGMHQSNLQEQSSLAKKKWSPFNLLKQLMFFLLGGVLTGFLTVFFAKLLGPYIGTHFSVSLGVGLAVAGTLWLSQLVKNPPFLLKGTSPLIAGFCAALGVHISRVWLS